MVRMSIWGWSAELGKAKLGHILRECWVNLSSLHRTIVVLLQWCVILIGLFTPISTALDNMLLVLILLGCGLWFRNVAHIATSHPIARTAISLFFVIFLAMFYGATPLKDAAVTLVKYLDLMFIPVFIFLISNETVQRRARYAFLLAMAVTLLLSYLVGLGVLPVMAWMNVLTIVTNPAIFHSHITQNNMMAFAVFLALIEWREANTKTQMLGWGLFVILGIINIVFMVQGRTGYLILLVLVGWFGWTTLERVIRRRDLNLGWQKKWLFLFVLFLGAVGTYHISSRLHDRAALVISEYQAWMQNNSGNTSIALRLDFYSNAFGIVKDNPLLGVGTGGFAAAYAQQVQDRDDLLTRNPHNEYLNIAVQAGSVGLVFLLLLFYTLWRYAPLLPTPLEQDAARGLVLAYLVNCMINSALMDHADGLFFAFMTGVLFSRLKLKSV